MKSKSNFSQIASKSLLIIILALSFSIATFAQSEDSSDETEIKLPDEIMQQVVKRILVYSFKPRKKATTIYLAEEGIKENWLPKIKNINFKLLSKEEIEKKDVYFIKFFGKEKKNYAIGFAFGNPYCSYEGKSRWSFRIVNERVKLWKENGVGFGGGCGSGNGYGETQSP
jgi:hypothetical protein